MVAVEPGRVGDADGVADLWVALAADQRRYGSHLLADENREVVREAFARDAVAGELLVARAPPANDDQSNGGIVGFATFGVESGRYDTDAVRGVVENVFVVPDRRGEEVGADLLAAAECRLADAGVDVVALEAMADNEAARRFYRRHGYSPHRVKLEKSVESDTLTKE
ncbi:GNAT family N-acetyltransferase [Halorussus halobius]|uniref:GNAT family N-acetyltransferase n=1 Tax=Halorussus halobius TaxID=1710537 RepID=UPI001092F4DD|nr:GNAT family N-acetyltransferase [Halorussus halobius]